MAHKFKKRFGQNFLRSTRFINALVEPLELSEQDTVIEIGPGDGAVTKKLIETGARVISVEIDYSLLPNLIKRFSNFDNFTLENENVLDLNIEQFLKDNNVEGDIKITGSLPYNIARKIIKKFLNYNVKTEGDNTISKMCFIVQDEVAKDYVVKPPKATFFSNYIQAFAYAKKLESIPKTNFYPTPKVNGAILYIEPESNQDFTKIKEFIKLIKIGFSSPRKTLIKNLKSSGKWEKDDIQKIWDQLELNPLFRPAEVGFETWVEILKKINSIS